MDSTWIGNDNASFDEVDPNNTGITESKGVFFMPESMPQNKLENFFFTVIMAFVMVYAMICYNIALNIGGLTDKVFLMAFGELRIMWPVAIVLEMFVMEKPVMYLTGRVINKNMSFFEILIIRCSLTVCLMCPTMSLVATILFKDFSHSGFVGMWLQTAAINFPMALAWQIFFGGPFGRLVFRLIFRRQKKTFISEDAELAEETAE